MWKRSLVHLSVLIGVLLFAAGSLTALLSAETPFGRVSGVLTAAETGKPLPGARVYLQKDQKQWEEPLGTRTDDEGRYTFDRVPVGRYKLIAYTEAHHTPETRLAVADGAVVTLDVALKPNDPFLRVHQGQRTFTTQEKVALRCHGFTPAKVLTVELYRFAPDVAPRAWHGWLPEVIQVDGKNLNTLDLSTVKSLTRVSSTPVPITHRDAEGVFRETLALGTLPPGTYLIAVKGGPVRALSMAAVTDLGLVAKVAAGKAMAYTVNLISGVPARGVAVEVRDSDRTRGRATTDTHGVAFITLPRDMDGSVEIIGRHGDSLAVATTYLSGNDTANPLRVYTYTDRPVYRPGHTVSFKSVARQRVGQRYRIPAPMTAHVRITDGNNDDIYKADLRTDTRGDLAGQFTLSDESIPGRYTISIGLGESTYEAGFTVAEYRKPEFEVQVKAARDRYTRGDLVRFDVNAQYYFGAPVGGAEVSYYVTRQPAYYYDAYAAWDSDLPDPTPGNPIDSSSREDYGEGEIVADGAGKTDDSGRLLVTVPPGQDAPTADGEDSDWRYTLHATVTDAAARGEEGSGSVLLTQGDLRMEITTSDYLTAPGQPVDITIRAMDYNNHPQAGISGNLEVLRAEWKQNREVLHSEGHVAWTTDVQGYATVPVTPAAEGDYRLRARAADHRQRRVRATGWLWVMSQDAADFAYPYQDLQVTANKHVYAERDTAEIVINTRHAPQQALLTIEGDRIFEQRPILLKNKSTVLKLPVSTAYLPNVDVGICFVKDKRFYAGQATINISRAGKALKVAVTPRKASYRPGDVAEFLVKTTTPDGHPARSDVSLGVVDEAIYAIQPDDTENITAFFYPRRWNQVQTAFSFPEVYLSGDDKAGANIKTRRFFPDTAFWNPSTLTNSRGEATFRVTLPDSLTTWRATCRAITADTLAGQAIAKTVVTKPFLVRVEIPRFLTQGDAATVSVVAHNLTDQPVVADLGLNVTGATASGNPHGRVTIAAGKAERAVWTVTATALGEVTVRGWAEVKGTGLNDAMALTLPVQARGRKTVRTWAGDTETEERIHLDPPTAMVPGSARLTIRLAPSLAASMLGSLDYLARYPYGCTEQTMSCFLPDVEIANLLKQSGTRNPALEKSLPKMVRDSLLRLYRFQSDDGGWGWWEHDRSDPWMTAYVVFGLRRAMAAGFSVNPNVLARGSEAMRNLAGRDDLLAGHNWESIAFLAWQLGETGQAEKAATVLDRLQKDMATVTAAQQHEKYPRRMSGWGWAMLALAQRAAGRDATAALERTWSIVDAVRTGAVSARTDGYDYYLSTDAAAMLLFAAESLTPGDPRVDGLVRWLMAHRRGDAWYSTRDTAFTLYGLSRYLERTNELRPEADVVVTVNGVTRDRYHIAPADVFAPERKIVLDTAALGNGPVDVQVAKTGTGRLYYSVEHASYTDDNLFAPAGTAEVTVNRVYSKLRRRGPAPKPPTASASDFTVGDVVEVTLTVQSTRPYEYLMIEDPLPAGCEPRDRGFIEPWEWDYWWTNQVVRDEMASFAIRYLEPNKPRHLTYRLTAMTAGSYLALPPRVFDMYNPDSWATGKAQKVMLRE